MSYGENIMKQQIMYMHNTQAVIHKYINYNTTTAEYTNTANEFFK